MHKKKAMTSEKASFVKLQGHRDAKYFAKLIGLENDYLNDPKAKKDVIDRSGDSYSVKSGEKKWQIFLYGKTRFEQDYSFKAMDGIGRLFLECIECFPESFNEYQISKKLFKEKLQTPMIELCVKLKNKNILSSFFDKAIFNSGEVNYLAIKDKGKYHVFWSRDVVEIFVNNITVENSKARYEGQMANQKVVFKIKGKTCGEIEMRNDSEIHYREIKFWLGKKNVVQLLSEKSTSIKKYGEEILIYGEAIKKFGKWNK